MSAVMQQVTNNMRVAYIISAVLPTKQEKYLVARGDGTFFWSREITRATKFGEQSEAYDTLTKVPARCVTAEDLQHAHLSVKRKVWLA